MTPQSAAPRAVLLLLFLFSGATGLVYELVWTRQLIFVFGGTTYAISTVLVAYMGGLGLGCYLAGRISARLNQPGVVYGGVEIVIGCYALIVPLLLQLTVPLYRAMYPHVLDQPYLLTAARFVLGAGILMIPTTLMGATLPILVRYVAMQGGRLGQSVGLLYGINTGGAMFGVLLTGFVLIPTFGLSMTTRVAAATNVTIGIIAIVLLRLRTMAAEPLRASVRQRVRLEPLEPGLRHAVLIVFAVSGFAAMAYQVTWTRALVMSLSSSTYSFTCILAAFIMGLSLGSLIVARFVDRWRNPALAVGVIEVAIGVVAVAILPVYGKLPLLVYNLVRAVGSDAYGLLITIEFLLIIAVTIVPTLLMGALFPLVARAAIATDNDEGAATGRAYGVNTIGTILGSFLSGFIMIEFVGIEASAMIASMLNALAGAYLIFLSAGTARIGWKRALPAAACVALVPGVWLGAGRWDPALVNSAAFYGSISPEVMRDTYEVAYYEDGVDLSVLVGKSRKDDTHLMLTVNASVNASTTYDDMVTNILLADVPLLLAQTQRSTCIIGLGCGVTLGAATRFEELERIDCIEISAEVIEAAALFDDYTYNSISQPDPRVNMIRADGRNHMLLTDQMYDVIISEPSHPWMSGVANLFTHEFFTLCREHLTEDGRMLVWLHGYDMSLDNFRLIVKTLADVFEFVSIWELTESDYGVIVGHKPFRVPLETFRRRALDWPVREDLYRVALGRPEKVLGRFLTSGRPVRDWANRDPRIHRDDNAIVEFTAPRSIYTSDEERIRDELFALARSPFDEIVVLDEQAPDQLAFKQAVANVLAARRKRVEAQRMIDTHQPGGEQSEYSAQQIGEVAVAGYRLDPGNMELFNMLRDKIPGASELFEAAVLPYPITGYTHDSSRDKVVKLVINDYVQPAVQAGRWQTVIHYLTELYELRPHNRRIALMLAEALFAAEDVDRLIAHFEDALERDVLTPAELEHIDPRIAALPEFHALLQRHPE